MAFSISCNTASTQPQHDSVTNLENKNQTQSKVYSDETQPVLPSFENKGLKIAWQNFTADGKYRLAQFSDMRFSEPAKQNLVKNYGTDIKPPAAVTIWGDLGFGKRVEEDHLAAIVIDTTKNDDKRFGLVIFSPPSNKKEIYDLHWLYKDRDLSRMTVNRASGYMTVNEYLDDGSQKGCFVEWNKIRKEFECK
jgi:hypothetical protein